MKGVSMSRRIPLGWRVSQKREGVEVPVKKRCVCHRLVSSDMGWVYGKGSHSIDP